MELVSYPTFILGVHANICVKIGGVGLNLTHGSIVVQLEVWWNRSTELQAVGRCHRQLQTESVLYIRMQAKGGLIDHEIRKVQRRKAVLNEELMRPLIRFHDEGPAHVPLLSFPGLAPLRWEEFRPSNPETFHHLAQAIHQNKRLEYGGSTRNGKHE